MDFGLTPPSSPRAGKTLCDSADTPISKSEALELLRSGILRGMVSERVVRGWPQNVWAVSATGEPFEAQLENPEQGRYHGYPMPLDDDFRAIVLTEWRRR